MPRKVKPITEEEIKVLEEEKRLKEQKKKEWMREYQKKYRAEHMEQHRATAKKHYYKKKMIEDPLFYIKKHENMVKMLIGMSMA